MIAFTDSYSCVFFFLFYADFLNIVQVHFKSESQLLGGIHGIIQFHVIVLLRSISMCLYWFWQMCNMKLEFAEQWTFPSTSIPYSPWWELNSNMRITSNINVAIYNPFKNVPTRSNQNGKEWRNCLVVRKRSLISTLGCALLVKCEFLSEAKVIIELLVMSTQRKVIQNWKGRFGKSWLEDPINSGFCPHFDHSCANVVIYNPSVWL